MSFEFRRKTKSWHAEFVLDIKTRFLKCRRKIINTEESGARLTVCVMLFIIFTTEVWVNVFEAVEPTSL